MFTLANEKKKLVWNAIPTVFEIPNPPARVVPCRKFKVRLSLPHRRRRNRSLAADHSTSSDPVDSQNVADLEDEEE
jgi:hypothetical protein